MRLRGILVVAALAAAQLGVALGQAATTTKTTAPSSSGISLSFDAPHGQLSASGFTLRPHPLTASPTSSVTGTVSLTITINLASKVAHDTQIPCGAIIIGGEADLSTPIVDGGIDTASSVAAVDWKTKTATCTVNIPYEWTLITDPSAGEGLFIGFAAAEVGRGDTTLRSTIQIGGPLPLPASGTTTTLAFTTTL
jgi:hypothetical protein